MNDLKTMKEKQINDYISNVLLNEDTIDVDVMKSALGTILGERPGLILNIKQNNLLWKMVKNPSEKKN